MNIKDKLNATTKVIESLHEENYILENQVETLEELVNRQKIDNSDLEVTNKTIEEVANNRKVGLSKSFSRFDNAKANLEKERKGIGKKSKKDVILDPLFQQLDN